MQKSSRAEVNAGYIGLQPKGKTEIPGENFGGERGITVDSGSRDKEGFMNKIRIGVALGLCVIALAAQAQSQSRKPGLWEVTSSMSMSGMPQMPQMSHTMQVCVTQAMIDKYGGPTSNPGRGNCQTTNVQRTATGMSANMTCSGQMNMTGTMQTTFVDANTTKTTVTMTMAGGNGQTMTMTTQSTATYKGPDCGSVKPLAMPASN